MRSVTVVLLCLAAGFAQGQEPPKINPYLVAMTINLRFVADGMRVPPVASRGEAIVSIPMQHLRTGVLRNDLRLQGFGVFANYVNAGAPGYFAGPFDVNGQSRGMWCFAVRPENSNTDVRCMVEYGTDASGSPIWAKAEDAPNRFFPVELKLLPKPSMLPVPDIEERPVKVHPDLRVEYVFLGWGSKHADVRLYLGGKPLLEVGIFERLPRETDGSVLLRLLGGVLKLEQVGTDRRRVSITQVQPLAP